MLHVVGSKDSLQGTTLFSVILLFYLLVHEPVSKFHLVADAHYISLQKRVTIVDLFLSTVI